MKQLVITLPMFGFIAGTRVALGLGIGLLVAGRFAVDRRRAAGALLVVAGAAATVPALRGLLCHRRPQARFMRFWYQQSCPSLRYNSA